MTLMRTEQPFEQEGCLAPSRCEASGEMQENNQNLMIQSFSFINLIIP